MESGIQNITNNYSNNQYYLSVNHKTKISILYNFKNVSTITKLKNSIVIQLEDENKTSIRETFDDEETAEDFFNYILIAISEKQTIISKDVYMNALHKAMN